MKGLFVLVAVLVVAGSALAHDYPPGEKQTHPILLKGGTLYTVGDGVKPHTDLLFENGRITKIAENIEPPEGAEVIDVAGMCVYPGLIAAGTQLGLIEIGAVQSTDDRSELGSINPDVAAELAYNPDSEILPTVRSNGIAYAQIVPNGTLLRGRSCLFNLDAWTREDAAEKLNVGLHVSWPSVGTRRGWDEQRSPEKQKEAQKKAREELRQAFEDALAYKNAKDANPNIEIDSRWESMIPVFTGKLPVYVHADDFRQVEEVVHFAEEFKLRMVLVGGDDAWKAAELLKQHDIPVIFGDCHGLPRRQDEPYDQAFTVPRLLQEAGVKFCIASGGATGVRNLPFDAAQAVAFGLDRNDALRAITLSAAEILGAAEEIGSLEVGKKATIIVSTGDILDLVTHKVTNMWIEGRAVDLDNKHKELYRKYSRKKLD